MRGSPHPKPVTTNKEKEDGTTQMKAGSADAFPEPINLLSGESLLDRDVCPVCQRKLASYRGMRVHMRLQHPVEYNDSLPDPKVSHTVWSEEELARMAYYESRTKVEKILSKKMGINQYLLSVLPGRTLDSIKSRRRFQDYKTLVETYVQQLQFPESMDDDTIICDSGDFIHPQVETASQVSDTDTVPDDSEVTMTMHMDNDPSKINLEQELRDLMANKPEDQSFGAEVLVRLMRRVLHGLPVKLELDAYLSEF